MTADAPRCRRGRPLKRFDVDPFAAPSFDQQRWDSLVTALATVNLGQPGGKPLLLGEALAELLFPTPAILLRRAGGAAPPESVRSYRNADTLPREDALFPSFDSQRYLDAGTAAQMNADGRAREAVDRWLQQRADPLWLKSIADSQRTGEIRRWAKRQRLVAQRLEAFAAAPHDVALTCAAAEVLDSLPSEPQVQKQPPLQPDPERLTAESLRMSVVSTSAQRGATVAAANELAVECHRVAAEMDDWLRENDTSHGRRALVRTVAAIVANLFDAAGAGDAVVFKRQSAVAAGLRARRPEGPYCIAV